MGNYRGMRWREEMNLKTLKITAHILQVIRQIIMRDSQAPIEKVIQKAC